MLGAVVTLAVIDALSDTYALELGPMMLMLGTGTVLLGVEISGVISRVLRNGS